MTIALWFESFITIVKMFAVQIPNKLRFRLPKTAFFNCKIHILEIHNFLFAFIQSLFDHQKCFFFFKNQCYSESPTTIAVAVTVAHKHALIHCIF